MKAVALLGCLKLGRAKVKGRRKWKREKNWFEMAMLIISYRSPRRKRIKAMIMIID